MSGEKEKDKSMGVFPNKKTAMMSPEFTRNMDAAIRPHGDHSDLYKEWEVFIPMA